MNPDGNHPLFPKLPDGTRDLDTEWSHVDTYKGLEQVLKTGKAKAIGVCNYSVKYLEKLLPQIEIVPAVNQVENHPYLPQQDLLEYCTSKGIVLTAYSPLGSTGSPLFELERVKNVARKYAVSPGTVLLSYGGRFFLSLVGGMLRYSGNRLIDRCSCSGYLCNPEISHRVADRGEFEDHLARCVRHGESRQHQ